MQGSWLKSILKNSLYLNAVINPRLIVIVKDYLDRLTKAFIVMLKHPICDVIMRYFECRYIMETEFNDVMRSNEFYQSAEHLMHQHDRRHVCQLTPDYMNKFCERVSHGIDSYLYGERQTHTLSIITVEEIQSAKEISNYFKLNKKQLILTNFDYLLVVRFTDDREIFSTTFESDPSIVKVQASMGSGALTVLTSVAVCDLTVSEPSNDTSAQQLLRQLYEVYLIFEFSFCRIWQMSDRVLSTIVFDIIVQP
ncbi:hypothetical protein RF11_02883 [Thelohanellus kitauei]|uniref:Uncharacterized protein n=1 Tax=Thelohanellus kitauei TaxID=669202 RepID=A0A0C2J0T3_THEKT|nr:hypothetical protein RF11_02883 [Thelohanellus kitauei]